LVTGFIGHLHLTTNNYDSFTELHTTTITVTTAHIKTSQSSLAVAWYRLPTADVSVSLGQRVRVILRLAVYSQSFRLGAGSLEAHDQYFLCFN
jgi:hypothetical protein